MRVIEIDGFSARCEARGIERNASLFLLQHESIQVGDRFHRPKYPRELPENLLQLGF